MRTNHPYKVEYTIAGIPHGFEHVYAPNRDEALRKAKEYLKDDGLAYDKNSLKVKREHRYSMR